MREPSDRPFPTTAGEKVHPCNSSSDPTASFGAQELI
jgi:hypothetical protein